MTAAKDRLIVALDVSSVDQAQKLIEELGDSVGVYKIGLELLFSGGFKLASELVACGARVFIDAKLLDASATVDSAALVKAGLMRRAKDGVRLLGNGELKAKVNFEVFGASKSAVEAVEKAGGSVKILAPKREEGEKAA